MVSIGSIFKVIDFQVSVLFSTFVILGATTPLFEVLHATRSQHKERG